MDRVRNAHQVAIAARPVRAAESGVGKANVGAQRNDAEGQAGSEEDQATAYPSGDQSVGEKRREKQGQVQDGVAEGLFASSSL